MIIDIILVVLFLIAAIWGAHKGGVKIIASLVSFVLAFVLAYTFANAVGDYVRNTSLGNGIQSAIENRIVNNQEQETEDPTKQETINEEQTDAITKIENVIEDKVTDVVDDGKAVIAEKIIGAVFYGIGFLTTFICVKLILFIVFLIINIIFKLPLLKSVNKLVGCILEIVLMLLKVWIVLGLISFVAPLDFMENIVAAINNSAITKLLYEHNIIVTLLIGKTI